MTHTPPTPPIADSDRLADPDPARPGRSEARAMVGRIAAGALSGAVRAVVDWLLNG